MPIVLTPKFSIAARALAEIDQAQLAQQAGLAVAALADFEAGVQSLDDQALADLVAALDHFGVELLPENESGVRPSAEVQSAGNPPDPRLGGRGRRCSGRRSAVSLAFL